MTAEPGSETTDDAPTEGPKKQRLWQQALPWAITIACFGWIYLKISGVAAANEKTVPDYLGEVFVAVDWIAWLGWMVPYSIFYLLIDTAILWRAINWFNTKIPYRRLLPIRASSYIISLLNEQVGKGAIAVYVSRTRGVPGWQVGSSLLFIMLCEVFYLIAWAMIGWGIARDALPAGLDTIPTLFVASLVVLAAIIFFFRSDRFANVELRDRHLFLSFRKAKLGHYLGIVAIRSPALIASFFVYGACAELFGLSIGLREMVGFLPIIFASTFIPGPFRGAAVLLWGILFPGEDPGKMAAFGFVQHNFFLVFNAAIGLLFVRKANRELFGDEPPGA